MANLNLFDTRGRWTPPDPAALATLSHIERANVVAVGNAYATLDAATSAIADNESALTAARAEIVALDKLVPRETFHDLIQAQCRETQRRRAGL